MPAQHLLATIPSPTTHSSLRISYIDATPSNTTTNDAALTILFIHGFPQSSHQFRHVITLLTAQGYRCIAPDYRGVGASKPPSHDFRKTTMALDMVALLDHLNLTEPIHVLGHDIGGMIAYALASRNPHRVRSLTWGECPLPGTETYRLDRTVPSRTTQQFHFIFHSLPDLASALVAGKERLYVEHFLTKITCNLSAFSPSDIDFYTSVYSQPGVMRSAMEMYAYFETDAEENRGWVRREGRCTVPSVVVSGEMSGHREEAEGMAQEVFDDEAVEVGIVKGAGHYLAEEAPEEFVEVGLGFIRRHWYVSRYW